MGETKRRSIILFGSVGLGPCRMCLLKLCYLRYRNCFHPDENTLFQQCPLNTVGLILWLWIIAAWKEWSVAEPSPFMFYKYFRQYVLVRYYVKATKNRIERDMPNITAEQKSSSEDLRSFFEWDLDFNFGLKIIASWWKMWNGLKSCKLKTLGPNQGEYYSSESESESWSGRSSGKSSYSFSGVSGLVTTGCWTWNGNKKYQIEARLKVWSA